MIMVCLAYTDWMMLLFLAKFLYELNTSFDILCFYTYNLKLSYLLVVMLQVINYQKISL